MSDKFGVQKKVSVNMFYVVTTGHALQQANMDLLGLRLECCGLKCMLSTVGLIVACEGVLAHM